MNTRISELEQQLAESSEPMPRISIIIKLVREIHRFNPQRSLALAREAMELAEAIDKPTALVRAASILAWALSAEDYHEEARKTLNNAELLLGAVPHSVHATFLHVRALTSYRTNHYQGTVKDVLTAIDLSKRSRPKKPATESRMLLALVYGTLQLYEQSMDFLLEVLDLTDRLNKPMITAVAYLELAKLHAHIHNDSAALDYFEKSRCVYEAHGDRYGESMRLLSLGSYYGNRKHYRQALECFRQSGKLGEGLHSYTVQASVQVNLGATYRFLNNVDKGLRHLEKAEELTRRSGDRLQIINILRVRGDLLIQADRFEEAETVLQKALEMTDDLEEASSAAAVIHCILVGLYERTGRIREALHHQKRYVELSERGKDKTLRDAILLQHTREQVEQLLAERKTEEEHARTREAEMRLKRNELTTLTLQLGRKREVLKKVRQNLAPAADLVEQPEQKRFSETLTIIDRELSQQNGWEDIEEQIQEFYPGFIQRITAACPELTSTQVKICSLLILPLSSQDIADLLHISIHTVNTHRYRIRNKLGLASGESLASFLTSL